MIKMKKFINKILIAALTVGSFTFTPEVYNLQQFLPIAHAEVKEYIGVGEYIMSKKETPDFAEHNAKMYAERNAQEQAGVFISNITEVKNSIVEKDEIVTFTAGILKVTKTDVEAIPLAGESSGYIKYRVTIRANIDTNDVKNAVNQWLNRSDEERTNLTKQNKNVQKIIDDLQIRIAELESKLLKANTDQDMAIIQEESAAINKDALRAQYSQKLDEANLLVAQKDYIKAFKLYNEILKINPNDAEVYIYRAHLYFDKISNPQKSFNDYLMALKLEPNYKSNRNFSYSLQNVLIASENTNNAINNLNEIIKIAPDCKYISWFYCAVATVFEFSDDYGKAIEYMEKAIQLTSDDQKKVNPLWGKSTAYFVISRWYEELGDKKKAKEYQRKSYKERDK